MKVMQTCLVSSWTMFSAENVCLWLQHDYQAVQLALR